MLLYVFREPGYGEVRTKFQVQLWLQSLGFDPEFKEGDTNGVRLENGETAWPDSNFLSRFSLDYNTPAIFLDADGQCFLWYEGRFARLRYDSVQVTREGVRTPRALATALLWTERSPAGVQDLGVPQQNIAELSVQVATMRELIEQMLRALLCQKVPEALLQQLAASADRLGIGVPFDDVEDANRGR